MTPAIPCDAVLDGEVLGVPAAEWRIQAVQARTVRELAGGGWREQFAVTEPDLPPVAAMKRFGLRWTHLSELRQTVAELLALPGEHQLILWRPEELAWPGDGSRTEFRLPNRWTLALDTFASPPGGVGAARFEPAVRITREGDPLTVTRGVDQTTYDAGPPAGAAYFLDGASTFKVGDVPAAGEAVYTTVHPVYQVLEDVDRPPKSFTGPIREPEELVLVEAGGSAP